MNDLHMHSWYSDDGEFMPSQLVDMCAARGIERMAITDHNSVKGVQEALNHAHTVGIEYIPGIEIDCTFKGFNLHMLGYDIDFRSGDFQQIEDFIHSQSAEASGLMLKKIREIGLSVSEDEIRELAKGMYRPDHWTGEMFAEVLLETPAFVEHPLLRPYRHGGERANNPFVNFYWDWFSQGKPCYTPVEYPNADEAIRIIHHSGGQAVIAHPGISLKGQTDLLTELGWLGLDGIEAQSSYHTQEQAAFFADAAKRLELFTTCGSDFHGRTKPSIQLGDYPDLTRHADIDTQHK